jgi:dienelactone hydrolase
MSCPDCFKGAIHDHAEPAGIEETLYGMRTYVAGGPSLESTSTSTVIFITDAFGFNLANSKLLADYYAAKTGLRVLVPDIIPGGGVPLYSLELTETVSAPVRWWDIRGQIRRLISLVRMLFVVIQFVLRTRRVFPTILAYARSIKTDLSASGKLGVAGFCWGGLQTTKLSQEPAIEGGKNALVDAHFTAHPAGLKPDDFVKGIRKFYVPFSMAIGDRDIVLSKDAVANVEATLRQEFEDDQQHHYEVRIYEGCGHGFAVRADPTKTVENEAAGKAADQAIEWFKRFLT